MKKSVADKKAALLKVALELFSEQGVHDTPMSQIAERANIGVGTIYRYFPSKEALIQSLYIEVHTRLNQNKCGNYPENGTAHKNFLLFMNTVVRYLVDHPAELSLLSQYESHPLSSTDEKESDSKLSESGFAIIFKKAMDEKQLKELPVSMLGTIISGMSFSLAKYFLNKNGKLDETELNSGIEAIWDSIKR